MSDTQSPAERPGNLFEKRIAEFDRLVGAMVHDLGNVVLPSRGGIEADDSELGRALAACRLSAGHLADHIVEIRGVLDQMRGRGADHEPRVILDTWWGQVVRVLRAMLRDRGPVRLAADDPGSILVMPTPVGRLLVLALAALDEQVEHAGVVTIEFEIEPGAPTRLRVVAGDATPSAGLEVPEPLHAHAGAHGIETCPMDGDAAFAFVVPEPLLGRGSG